MITKAVVSKPLAPHHIRIGALLVEVVRKDIKNLHLGVYPPNGRVRVATPLVVDDEAVRLAVIEKLGWINRQKFRFTQQPRQSPREMVSGESHYFLGRRYRLRVHVVDTPAKAAPRIATRGIASLDLFVRPDTSTAQRDAALQRWYRSHLKELIEPLLQKWQPLIGVQAAEWGIKKMKTKWGSCNTSTQRIWLNLELAKKPVPCIEYIVVHELVHLLERNHTERFSALMDSFLPNWRACRETLNHGILGHEVWDY